MKFPATEIIVYLGYYLLILILYVCNSANNGITIFLLPYGGFIVMIYPNQRFIEIHKETVSQSKATGRLYLIEYQDNIIDAC